MRVLDEASIRFRDDAKAAGAEIIYEEEPGIHDWDFWYPYIRKVLDWLPLKEGYTR